MKRKAIALLVVMVGIAIGVASAQSNEPLTFRMPFAFTVGDQQMPAGEYTLLVPSPTGLLSIRNRADGNIGIFIASFPVEKPEAAGRYKLVFHLYGSQYYMSEVWVPGYRTGRMIIQHPSERQVAKNGEPQHVTVYLSAQAR